MTDTVVRRPILRYFGGKFRLAPWLISHMPPVIGTYVEPFAGAASVLLRKPKDAREVLIEKEGVVCRFMEAVREHGDFLKEVIRRTKPTRFTYESAHRIPISELFPEGVETSFGTQIDHAANVLTRSFLTRSQNGVFEKSTFRDHPISLNAWKTLPQSVLAASERLQGVEIVNGDWSEMWGYDSEETFFYLDPPYVLSSRTSAHRYRSDFNDEDHRELARTLNSPLLRGRVMLSGYESTLYDEIFPEGKWIKYRRSSAIDVGQSREEVIWVNYDTDYSRIR